MSTDRLVVIAVNACLLSSVAAYVLWRLNPNVALEHHEIESTQAGLLMLASMLHLYYGWSESNQSARHVRDGLALLCLSFFMREIDIHELGDEAVIYPLEYGLRGVVVVLWIIFALRVWFGLGGLVECRWRVALSSAILFSITGCLLYAASWPFDKEVIRLDEGWSLIIEETLQLNATILFVIGAFGNVVQPRGIESE
ncbi:MAG: hypothetical protein EA377_13155 [Phycisphaerales bacterium]|nr:MAG: hypothetical protein EA377_13155 [Phycisphaerales bacterium]